jgi:hypothetical protein
MALSHRSQQFFRRGFLLAAAALLIAFAGCATTKELDNAKALQKAEKYEQLAALTIKCTDKDEGCNQLHLLKGDACFRLAKQTTDDTAKQSWLDCAVTELATGIRMTQDWKIGQIDRAQYYENSCEADRLRADYGDRPRFEGMLASCADQFIAFAPDHPGAIFYDVRAKFYPLTQAANPCNGLRALDSRVTSAARRFGSEPRYAEAYQALKTAVGVELQRRCGN